MKIVNQMFVTTLAALFFALPVMAASDASIQVAHATVTPVDVQKNVLKDEDLAAKSVDFERFAKSKVQQLNRNHIASRSRMKVTRQADGTYRGRYHQIDDSTLSVKVNRSKSGSIPFVGVLSYREQVFESSAGTVEQLDQGLFALVEVIPNRHIFSYQKGVWN